MIDIKPTETVLTGQWIMEGGRIVADSICRRIEALIKSHLVAIGRDKSGWDALYRDPADGRLWELIYPQSELQGGGPQQQKYIAADEAKDKYGLP